MKPISTIIAILVLGVLAVVGFVFFGGFNIAADSPHSALVFKLIEAARERSIATHTVGIQSPALDDPALIAEGAEHYGAMCAGCHLAPGRADTAIRKGLYPQPPDLSKGDQSENESTQDRNAEAVRQFWVIKHGIKASAMPAWGATHDDNEIWALVAFVQKLPTMSPDDYARLTMTASAHEHDHMDHDAADHHDHDDEAGEHHLDEMDRGSNSTDHDHEAHDDAGHDVGQNAAQTHEQ